MAEALNGGEVNADLRYRLERVDQDGFDENPEASIARLRLGCRTVVLHGFSASFGRKERMIELMREIGELWEARCKPPRCNATIPESEAGHPYRQESACRYG